jgi:hypothetical protein
VDHRVPDRCELTAYLEHTRADVEWALHHTDAEVR